MIIEILTLVQSLSSAAVLLGSSVKVHAQNRLVHHPQIVHPVGASAHMIMQFEYPAMGIQKLARCDAANQKS